MVYCVGDCFDCGDCFVFICVFNLRRCGRSVGSGRMISFLFSYFELKDNYFVFWGGYGFIWSLVINGDGDSLLCCGRGRILWYFFLVIFILCGFLYLVFIIGSILDCYLLVSGGIIFCFLFW